MAIGDQYRRIAPDDQLIFDSTGALIGVKSGRSSSAELRTLSASQLAATQALVSKYGFFGRPYLGQFSSGARLPNLSIVAGTATQLLSRSRYIARNTITGPQFAWPNWMTVSNNGGLETGTGGAATITAALEYNGVAYPMTWDGATSVTVADLATSTLCDPIGVSIANGDAYFIRTYYTNASGIICETGNSGAEAGDNANGEDYRYATTGLTDTTNATGAITGGTSAPQNRYGPILHVANITAPSVLILGTSLQMGFRETSRGGLGFGDKGIMSRCIGPYFGYANVAQGGASANNFLTAGRSDLRQALKKYFTHTVNDFPVNEILNENVNAPVIASRLTRIAALFPDQANFLTTTLPRTTGAWTLADGSDQTVYTVNSWATRRPAINALIKAGIGGYAGFFDTSSAAELGSNSEKWFADGSASFMFAPYGSPDGLHLGRQGAERIRAAGVFDPTMFLR